MSTTCSPPSSRTRIFRAISCDTDDQIQDTGATGARFALSSSPRIFFLPGKEFLCVLCNPLCALCPELEQACGQKGPPLAPIVFLPRAVTDVAAKRVEDEVVVQFTVPTLNTDGSSPADLRRIEVYGHTGPLPTPADFLKYGTLVASIDIEEPPQPKEESKEPVAPQEGAGGSRERSRCRYGSACGAEAGARRRVRRARRPAAEMTHPGHAD